MGDAAWHPSSGITLLVKMNYPDTLAKVDWSIVIAYLCFLVSSRLFCGIIVCSGSLP